MNTLTNSKYTILVVGDDVDANTTVVFLLESDSVTGQTIFVDGGRHLMS